MSRNNIPLADVLAELSPEERAGVEMRAQAIADRQHTLNVIRKLRRRSQQQIAEGMGLTQSVVSKIERNPSPDIMAIRGFVEAAGGRLYVVATFPGSKPVRFAEFSTPRERDS